MAAPQRRLRGLAPDLPSVRPVPIRVPTCGLYIIPLHGSMVTVTLLLAIAAAMSASINFHSCFFASFRLRADFMPLVCDLSSAMRRACAAVQCASKSANLALWHVSAVLSGVYMLLLCCALLL